MSDICKNIELIKRFHLTATVGDHCFHNGFEYVDLGLPSGTLWATTNVGAKSIEDGGLYFQWGDTQGYTKLDVDNGKKEFSTIDYKYGFEYITKYNSEDGKTVLDLEDDAAHVHLGGSWRMPTSEEINELISYTNNELVEINGLRCAKFTSKTDCSKIMFIPASGFIENGVNTLYGNNSYLLTSTLSGLGNLFISTLSVTISGIFISNLFRFRGHPIRGILSPFK